MSNESGTARIVLEVGKCTGLGICESFAPDFFEVQDDGSLVVISNIVPPEALDQVAEAVRSCPTEALRIETA